MNPDDELAALQTIIDETLALVTDGRIDDALLCLVAGLARTKQARRTFEKPLQEIQPELRRGDEWGSAILVATAGIPAPDIELHPAGQLPREQAGPESQTAIKSKPLNGKSALARLLTLKARARRFRAQIRGWFVGLWADPGKSAEKVRP